MPGDSCKICTNIIGKWGGATCNNCRLKKYKERNIGEYKKYHSKYRSVNKLYINTYKKKDKRKNPEKYTEYNRTYRIKHKEKLNIYLKYYSRLRSANKLQACPQWVNQEQIKEIYINCPVGQQVDHIIPLKSKSVCGLHVPWNFQYLTKKDNGFKSNKFDFTRENNGWRGK